MKVVIGKTASGKEICLFCSGLNWTIQDHKDAYNLIIDRMSLLKELLQKDPINYQILVEIYHKEGSVHLRAIEAGIGQAAVG